MSPLLDTLLREHLEELLLRQAILNKLSKKLAHLGEVPDRSDSPFLALMAKHGTNERDELTVKIQAVKCLLGE